MKLFSSKYISSLYRPRQKDAHKGDHGHGLIVAGSRGKMGAAVIAVKACLRSGAGLVSALLPEEGNAIMQTAVPEAMLYRGKINDNELSVFDSIAIGPGLGTGVEASRLLKKLLRVFRKPIVLDADALNIISQNRGMSDIISEQSILTPHEREFDRLFGIHCSRERRIETAIRRSAEMNNVIVLKGRHTLVAAYGDAWNNTTGNPGLAKGGTGDALTGMLCALLAQGYPAREAAQLGVYLHGLAADISLQKQSEESMIVTDIIENFGAAFKTLTKIK